MSQRTGPASWSAAFGLVALAGRSGPVAQAGLAAVQAVLPLAGLVAMQRLIDAVAAGLAGRLPAEVALRDATLATVLAGVVAFLGNALRGVSSLVGETHGRALSDAVTLRVQQQAATLDLAAFDRPAFHELLQRAGAEASQRPVRLLQDALAVLVAGLGLVTMVWLLAGVSWWLPGLVAATAVPIALVRRRHGQQRADWQAAHLGEQRDVGYAGAVLTGRATAKDVRTLALQGFWSQRLVALRGGLRQSLRQLAGRRGRDDLLVHTVSSVGLFIAYYVLAKQALAGGLSLGELVLQAQAAQRAQNGVRDLLAALAGVHEHRLFLQPVVDLLALRPALVAAPPPATPPPGPLAIEAAELCFRYPEGRDDVLHGLTFTLGSGERVALVGQNGSGKSTLGKLLARLYAPTGGSLRGNGVDLRHVEPAAWRPRLAVLLQDAALFELTVRENLGLGHAAPPAEARLWQVLEVVGLAARLRALPHGLDTMCSRRHAGGVEWSTGEARRLLLARALAQPADLLLLDEPFLALDGVLAESLAGFLAASPRDRTVLVIDHRPQAIRWVDRVLVLDAGRLVADGPPAELVHRHPGFRALFPPDAGR